jgi:hypothetical protein
MKALPRSNTNASGCVGALVFKADLQDAGTWEACAGA